MSTSETTNRELVRGYLDAVNDRDRDAFAEYLAADVVEHGIHRELQGIDEILEFLQQHFEIFPDYTGRRKS